MNISLNNTTSDAMASNICFNTFEIHTGRNLQHEIYVLTTDTECQKSVTPGLVGLLAVFFEIFTKNRKMYQSGTEYYITYIVYYILYIGV